MIIKTSRSSKNDYRLLLTQYSVLVHCRPTTIACTRSDSGSHLGNDLRRLKRQLSSRNYNDTLYLVTRHVKLLNYRQKISQSLTRACRRKNNEIICSGALKTFIDFLLHPIRSNSELINYFLYIDHIRTNYFFILRRI